MRMVFDRHPLVSVLVPTYQSHQTVLTALRSVFGGRYQRVECVVSPDDGEEYGYLLDEISLSEGQSLQILPPSEIRSGPGAARNRALRHSNGELIALLDADDEWNSDYLAGLVPKAIEHGIAFGSTHYVDEFERVVRRIPAQPMPEITLAMFSNLYGSFHAVVRRSYCREFATLHAEDILHDASCLAAVGGVAPVVPSSVYKLKLHPGSCTGRQSEHIFQDAYSRLVHLILEVPESLHLHELTLETRTKMAALFNELLRASIAYGTERAEGESYHGYILRSQRFAPI